MSNNLSANYNDYDYLMSITILGYPRVGKSSLLQQALFIKFKYRIFLYTIGSKEFHHHNNYPTVDLMASYLCMTQMTSTLLNTRIKSITIGARVSFMLIGSKADLNNKQVTAEEASQFARENSMLFFEVSSLESTNVNVAFEAFFGVFKNIVKHKNNQIMIPVPKMRYNCI